MNPINNILGKKKKTNNPFSMTPNKGSNFFNKKAVSAKCNKAFGPQAFGNSLFGQTMKGASQGLQNQWNNFSKPIKQELRKVYPDKDRDGVPNRWDCQPRNPYRQEKSKPTLPLLVRRPVDDEEFESLTKAEMKQIPKEHWNKLSKRYPWILEHNPYATKEQWDEELKSQPGDVTKHPSPTKEQWDKGVAYNPWTVIHSPYATKEQWDKSVERQPQIVEHSPYATKEQWDATKDTQPYGIIIKNPHATKEQWDELVKKYPDMDDDNPYKDT